MAEIQILAILARTVSRPISITGGAPRAAINLRIVALETDVRGVGADTRSMLPPEQRKVGMVFQDLALFPHLTVGDNIAFGMRGKGKKEIDKRVEELLELV
jgi:ABC-type Fe3+/spermidine/putrescine transport system ATPase subunit